MFLSFALDCSFSFFFFYFSIEELDTRKEFPAWIRAGDHVSPVKSSSLALKVPMPKISEGCARDPPGGAIITPLSSHI